MENTVQTLTAAQRSRALASLTETCQLLEKEMAYSEDLRKQDKIAFYNKHIAKLEKMLDTNSWDPAETFQS